MSTPSENALFASIMTWYSFFFYSTPKCMKLNISSIELKRELKGSAKFDLSSISIHLINTRRWKKKEEVGINFSELLTLFLFAVAVPGDDDGDGCAGGVNAVIVADVPTKKQHEFSATGKQINSRRIASDFVWFPACRNVISCINIKGRTNTERSSACFYGLLTYYPS